MRRVVVVDVGWKRFRTYGRQAKYRKMMLIYACCVLVVLIIAAYDGVLHVFQLPTFLMTRFLKTIHDVALIELWLER